MLKKYKACQYEGLRREIEVRLMRETVYRAVEALNTKGSLEEAIKDNDGKIELIGRYLLDEFGDGWEKVYRAKYPR